MPLVQEGKNGSVHVEQWVINNESRIREAILIYFTVLRLCSYQDVASINTIFNLLTGPNLNICEISIELKNVNFLLKPSKPLNCCIIIPHAR